MASTRPSRILDSHTRPRPCAADSAIRFRRASDSAGPLRSSEPSRRSTSAPPTWREGEVSTELDTAASLNRAHADVLLQPDAERELDAELEVVSRRIDAVD